MKQKKYQYELKKIKDALSRLKDPVIRERLLMVQAALKYPLREATKDFGCVHSKLDYWKKRYLKHGLKGLYTLPRSGRPKKISKEDEIILKRKVSKHDIKRGWRTKRVKEEIFKQTGVKYSERQVIRITQSWGLSQQKPRQHYAYARKEDKDAFIKKTKPD